MPYVRQAIISALNSIGHPSMPERIKKLLKSENPYERESAVKIAGYFGYEECKEEIFNLVNDKDEEVRKVAYENIVFFEDEKIFEILKEGLEKEKRKVREVIARSLIYLGKDKALPLVEIALRDSSPWVRYYGVKSLVHHNPPDLLSILQDLLSKEDTTLVKIIIIESIGKTGNVKAIDILKMLMNTNDKDLLLAEQSLVGVFVIQEEKVIYVNPRFVEIFGYPTGLKTFNDFLNYIYEEDRERFKQRYHELLDKTFEYIIDEFKIKKGKDIAYIEMSMVGIMYKGKPAILGTTLDITYRKKMEEELKILSITDPLTGLYNRRGFITLADHTLNLVKRLNKKAIILFIDLDYMKWINDNLGHNVGDQALIDVANILTSTFRQNDLIARIGGDEFVVLGIIGEENHKEKIIERLTEKVKEFNTKEKRPYKLSLSVGYVVYDPENPKTLEELLQLADQLMYEEKRLKKQNNQYPFGRR
ncbi:diguanylate cyclase [Dictyoglomus sp.]|uniref:diguanylate cyclase n=2 Tax=Dictyoglomus TaxID=13 RepID=UPI003D137FE2